MGEYIANNKVLYIDDEANLLSSFKSLMKSHQFEVFTLEHSGSIDKIIDAHGPFALVLADERMPELSGHKLLEFVKFKSPETVRVLVTGYANYEDTIKAINVGGISKYISKPWDDDELVEVIHQSVSQYNEDMEKEMLVSQIRNSRK